MTIIVATVARIHDNTRYCDPVSGRFTQPDTIVPDPGNPQDLNRYTYVRDNPATFNDPSGGTAQARAMPQPRHA